MWTFNYRNVGVHASCSTRLILDCLAASNNAEDRLQIRFSGLTLCCHDNYAPALYLRRQLLAMAAGGRTLALASWTLFALTPSTAESARHETTGKQTTAPKCRRGKCEKGITGREMRRWKVRETEVTTQCCRGGGAKKMRDIKFRKRQTMESR